jgi:hypothetical protein
MSNIDPHAHNPLEGHFVTCLACGATVPADLNHSCDTGGYAPNYMFHRDFATDRKVVPTLHYSRRRAVWMRVRVLVWILLLYPSGVLACAVWMRFSYTARLSDALWATACTIVAIACILQLRNRKG